MDLPDIRKMDVKGKRVLVRADLNVPMRDGKITDDNRLRAALPTFRNIMERGGRLAVIAHLDRPGGKRDPSTSLLPVADALGAALKTEVAFCDECVGQNAQAAVDRLDDGGCVVLENLRFHAGEKENDDGFAEALAALGELYVNDAFSASHREHASIVGLAGRLPSAAGLLMQKELENLERHLEYPARPYCALLGGAKAKTKVPLVEQLLPNADRILLGGAMATTFLKAQGLEIGASKYADDCVETAAQLLRAASQTRAHLMLPVDVLVADELNPDAKTKAVGVQEIEADAMIVDIGPETIRRYADAIGSEGTVVWNGPVGAAEHEAFRNGTLTLASAIAERTHSGTLVSVIGGGDTTAFLREQGLLHRFSYASMAGGAFLQWLSGEPLPGVRALRQHG